MSYDAREISAHDGAPVELYRFSIGLDEWLYTSADRPFQLSGKTYTPVYIERGDLSVTDETPRESLDVSVARNNPVAALFNAQAPDGTMYLTVFREHRGESDFIQLGRWRVLSVSWSNSQAVLKCQPLFTALARPLLRLRFATTCRHALFDIGCTLSKAGYRVPAHLIAHIGGTMQAAEFAAMPDGWFIGGEVDAGAGRRRRIIAHAADIITLTANIPDIGAGDDVDAYPGCDKVIGGDCLNKFSNTPNHGGFPYIPHDNPFEKGVA